MKFLVDANLAPRVAARLGRAGHEASHVDEIGLGTASDEAILDRAHEEAAVVLTADADFGALLALSGRAGPSVILLRSADHLTPDGQADLVLHVLDRINDELEAGAVASVTTDRIRIRLLPVTDGP
jgi:predicted nuclease of predicted toxin-antitoxin system